MRLGRVADNYGSIRQDKVALKPRPVVTRPMALDDLQSEFVNPRDVRRIRRHAASPPEPRRPVRAALISASTVRSASTEARTASAVVP
jgi:hypothetical protein